MAAVNGNKSTDNADGDDLQCAHCKKSLAGQRYILNNNAPHCLPCYEQVVANPCHKCQKKIGCDSKDLSYKDAHWHGECFTCTGCNASLVEQSFLPHGDSVDHIFCTRCYEEKFAPRCDACGEVFPSGSRKYEHRGQNYHENCFLCGECHQAIGTKNFITCEQVPVCMTCYEAKYAQKCLQCSQVIRQGGVTYRNGTWHKECFVCARCNKQLSGVKFINKEEHGPHCMECYGEVFAKKCCKCAKPILGAGGGGCKFISFEERHWHSECFNCGQCNANLVGKGFHTQNDAVVCSACYH